MQRYQSHIAWNTLVSIHAECFNERVTKQQTNMGMDTHCTN